jgi:selenocysteine-specific elongation factor
VAVRLRSSINGVWRDPFVVRSLSPQETIAGGFLIWPIPGRKWRKHSAEFWETVAEENGYAAAKRLIDMEPQGLSVVQIAQWIGETTDRVFRAMSAWVQSGAIVAFEMKNETQLIAMRYIEKELAHIAKIAKEYHKSYPESEGISVARLRDMLGGDIHDEIWKWCMAHLDDVDLEVVEQRVRSKQHRSQVSKEVQKEADRICDVFARMQFAPPKRKDICKSAVETIAFNWLCETGRLIHITGDMWLTTELRDKLIEIVRSCLENQESATVAELKAALGTTRKYAIAMLEYLDEQRITVRRGDVRMLRQ